jgi:hypothetical protein
MPAPICPAPTTSTCANLMTLAYRRVQADRRARAGRPAAASRRRRRDEPADLVIRAAMFSRSSHARARPDVAICDGVVDWLVWAMYRRVGRYVARSTLTCTWSTSSSPTSSPDSSSRSGRRRRRPARDRERARRRGCPLAHRRLRRAAARLLLHGFLVRPASPFESPAQADAEDASCCRVESVSASPR